MTSPPKPPTWMRAEILFPKLADVDPASALLALFDFQIDILDRADEFGGVWITATAMTALDQGEFLDLMRALVEPIGGEVHEVGPVNSEPGTRP